MIIWLASYPRTGNTLLRMMLKNVFDQHTYSKYDDPFDIGADAATADLVGHRNLPEKWEDAYRHMRESSELFLVKTHEAPEDDAPAVYVTRDGRAACVSYFNYLRTYMPGSQDVEMGDVVSGFVRYGSWSRHLDTWRPYQRPNTLVLRFEDLLKDPKPAIEKLAQFCHLETKHDWVNDFAGAQKVNPKFFRQGSAETSRAEVQGDDLALFWLLHRDWMSTLGYEPDPPPIAAEAPLRLRTRIGTRQEEIVNLREKLSYLQKWADDRAIELESERLDRTERLTQIARLGDALKDQAKPVGEQLAAAIDTLRERDGAVFKLEEDARRASEQIAHLEQVQVLKRSLEQRYDQLAGQLDDTQRQLRATETDRDIWRNSAIGYESQLRRIETMRWHQRIYDTVMRLVKNLYLGFPFAGRPAPALPRLTIVTPAFNAETTIRACIDSVLAQGYPDLEYIVVDGGSTDRTAEIAREYVGRGVTRLISEKDNGMYDAIAKGFQLASGVILGYLNADDLFEPGGLLRVGAYFRQNPRSDLVYHEDTVSMDGWRFPNNAQPPHVDRRMLMRGHILFQDGVFFRRDAYLAAGGVNRSMRRAGDWDLWMRLASVVKFRRNHGHVSSFRVRAGQLSGDLDAYYAEVEARRPEWAKKMRGLGGAIERAGYVLGTIHNAVANRLRRRRFFYPLQKSGCIYGFKPSPGVAAPENAPAPRCPLTGEIPDRLLFSSRDTRFGDPLINYVYYNTKSDVAIVWPPLTKEQLNVLYEKHYSSPATQVTPPPDGFVSPYRNYFGGGLIDRIVMKIPMPARFASKVRWDDKTVDELLDNLPELPRAGANVNFLDVGCFEGNLLDLIKQRTDWKTSGLEPNANAVAVAQAKGHRVWQGFAEDAVYVVSEGVLFDVIYMGQTIEHLLDPLTVVRRLRTLLKPGGRLVISTPNLRAKQIELFGPTWAHWHVPYHRNLFSAKSLGLLARLSEFDTERVRHYSHPYWTCLSVALNQLGVGAVVPHAVNFGTEIVQPALSLTAWSHYLWDWRGKGDYVFVVLKRSN